MPYYIQLSDNANPLLQETCSLQKERIKMLEQELAFAKEKLKVMVLSSKLSHLPIFRYSLLCQLFLYTDQLFICFLQMVDASMSHTMTEFEEQKQRMHELQERLADTEHQLCEGELLRKKLHNTILVRKCPFGNIFKFQWFSLCALSKAFISGTQRKHTRILPSAPLATR